MYAYIYIYICVCVRKTNINNKGVTSTNKSTYVRSTYKRECSTYANLDQ